MDSHPKAIGLAIVAGARPNFMKVAPLIRSLKQDPDFHVTLIHTGQHYDDNMSGQIFRDLEIPPPDHNLEVGSGTHAQQTAEIMKRIEPILRECSPRGVIVVGDVNSTVAGALVAKKIGVEVIDVEAGLRSFDRAMPEEINRIVTDSITDLFLVTEQSGVENLRREGCDPQRIYLVGNLMIDSLQKNLRKARESDVCERIGVKRKNYGLVTLHRPANVDDREAISDILRALATIAEELPLVWPMHPRVKAQIVDSSLSLPANIAVEEPLGYLDFLCLEANSVVVLTDSGGVQEETTALGIECLTIRENTERPVTLEMGTNRLAGTKSSTILAAWKAMHASSRGGICPPLWDGRAAERCHNVLRNYFSAKLKHSP